MSPRQHIATYHCQGLLRDETGAIVKAERDFQVGITFHDGYQDEVNIPLLLTWMEPRGSWRTHP